MRKLIWTAVLVAGLGMAGSPSHAAASANAAISVEQVSAVAADPAGVQEARLYCHRGPVFLHWGPCGGYRPVYRSYRPVYHSYRPIYRRSYYRGYRRY